jgi:hypothetical protein
VRNNNNQIIHLSILEQQYSTFLCCSSVFSTLLILLYFCVSFVRLLFCIAPQIVITNPAILLAEGDSKNERTIKRGSKDQNHFAF